MNDRAIHCDQSHQMRDPTDQHGIVHHQVHNMIPQFVIPSNIGEVFLKGKG